MSRAPEGLDFGEAMLTLETLVGVVRRLVHAGVREKHLASLVHTIYEREAKLRGPSIRKVRTK